MGSPENKKTRRGGKVTLLGQRGYQKERNWLGKKREGGGGGGKGILDLATVKRGTGFGLLVLTGGSRQL